MATTAETLPPPPLHARAAWEVVGLLRDGVVTPSELIDVVERRWAETEDLVHATPITCFDRARAAAANLQRPSQPPPGYLYGLPVLIKDTSAVAGVRFTEGSKLFENRVAEESDPLVEQLEEKGAIVVGKTNVPEFAAGSQAFNEIFPTTVSPWDVRTAAGGSSGGSAAALASCQCWLATGSDLGGSLRNPAAFCGIVGFRPSPGRVPCSFPSGPRLGLHATNGPMGRSVRDVGLLLDAMAGNLNWSFAPPALPDGDTFETAAIRGASSSAVATATGRGWQVAFSTLGCALRPEVEALCRSAAKLLQGGGAEVEDLPPSALDVAAVEKAFLVLRGEMFATQFQALMAEHPALADVAKPEIMWNMAVGQQPEAPALAGAARQDLARLQDQVEAIFERVDILCAPASMDASFDAGVRYPVEQQGQAFTNYLGWMKPAFAGTVLLCPTLSLPVGFLPDGRPVGMQLLGPPGADARVLEAAAYLESLLNLPTACPEPRRGTVELRTAGPRTRDEARAHHEGEERRFVERFCAEAKL